MLVRELKDCDEFIAGDGSFLREILHPAKEDLKLRYSLAHAKVKSGQVTKEHQLKTSEVYFILSGQGVMHIDRESREVRPGATIYIPPHSRQWIENKGPSDLEFLCLVDPAWRREDEEVLS